MIASYCDRPSALAALHGIEQQPSSRTQRHPTSASKAPAAGAANKSRDLKHALKQTLVLRTEQDSSMHRR